MRGLPSAGLLVHDGEEKSHLWEILDLATAWEGLRRPRWVLWSFNIGTRRSRVISNVTTLHSYMQASISASAWYGSPCATAKLRKASPSASCRSPKGLPVRPGPCLEVMLQAIPRDGLLGLLHAELLIRLQDKAAEYGQGRTSRLLLSMPLVVWVLQ